MFEKSLKLQETGQLMMPADAITTQLYKHQMYALAWMANRENAQEIGVAGGILADDMGLGKTLTALSLIVTNFHDKRPLAKPDFTFSRAANRHPSVIRYIPGLSANLRKIPRITNKLISKPESDVGAKLNGGGTRRKVLASAFEHLVPKRRKDNKQQVKSSNNFLASGRNSYSSLRSNSGSAFDSLPSPERSEEEGEHDEFDSMCFNTTSTLSERLLGSNEKSNEYLLAKRERHFYDGLSDDEEYQNMTEKERNERLRPKFENQNVKGENMMNKNLNIDGMPNDLLSSSEDEDFVSTTTLATKKIRRISSDEDEKESNNRDKGMSSCYYRSDLSELPDITEGEVDNENNIDHSKDPNGQRNGLLEIKSTNLQRKTVKNRKSISNLGKSCYLINENSALSSTPMSADFNIVPA